MDCARLLRVLLAATAVASLVAIGWGCNTSARSIDACKQLEQVRCEQGDKCPGLLAGGDVESCKNFYAVQCGRGVNDAVRDPTLSELEACLAAIKGSCAVARAPESSSACAFLGANTDAATPDGDAADTDAADAETTAETTPADTAPAETTPADSVVPPDTTPADSAVPPDTTPADSTPSDAPVEADAGADTEPDVSAG